MKIGKTRFRGGTVMPDRNRLLAIILMNAALPLTKTLVEEKPRLSKRYRGWHRIIQFQIKNDAELACYLSIDDGEIQYSKGRHPKPHLDFIFNSPGSFNSFFTGKIVMPKIRGALRNAVTLLGILPLLLGLTILMPAKLPKDKEGRYLKVKLLLYFITVALSQANKAGDEDMVRFTQKMPDRVFQWSVEANGPAAYLRVKDGRTKAGRGIYTRRRPFVHMIFASIDSAFLVLTGQIDNVEAMKQNQLIVDGSPEYGKDISSIMKKIESLIA
jgi:hypothetical protein